MLVIIESERIGYIARPVSLKWSDKFADHMYEMTGSRDSSVFWQEDYNMPEEVQSNRQYGYLQKGWPIMIRVDPWAYGHWLGYDAHTVAE